MEELWNIFISSYQGYANYLWNEITHPGVHNYFYALTVISMLFFALEIIVPWRKNQGVFRRDFWLDFFYMYFNFFIFSLIIYNAGSDVVVQLIKSGFLNIGIDLSSFNPLVGCSIWLVLLFGFVLRDFVQWWTHRLLHRVSWLWKFHQVHHSVKEMGFAAHLRYHWMETIVYRTIEYLPLAFFGIGLYDFFIIHIFSLLIGHYNHSNLTVPTKITGAIFGGIIGFIIGSGSLGTTMVITPTFITSGIGSFAGIIVGYFILSTFIKFLFNSPEMHIWHHAMHLPNERKFGVNFGLSLAVWDYLFRTAYIPSNGRDIELGFPGDKQFPQSFFHQITFGFFNR